LALTTREGTTLHTFRYPDAEFPPLGEDRGDKSIYFDEYTEHCHEGNWNWCSHCGDGGTSTENPQWRRREHFEEFHQREVRRAERRAAQLQAAPEKQTRAPRVYNSVARWCAGRESGCQEMIPAGANPLQKFHSESCRKRSEYRNALPTAQTTPRPTGSVLTPGERGGSVGKESEAFRNALKARECAYAHCSRPFTPKTVRALYCSDGCRQAAHRTRVRG
jgi:hypothetical protein